MIEKRNASKSICTLPFVFKEAIRKNKTYLLSLLNLANFEKEISFPDIKFETLQIEGEESQFNCLLVLKSRINFHKFYKKLFSVCENFVKKKKIILIKNIILE